MKNSKRKLLFIVFMLTLMLISSANAILIPDAHASQLTSPQKAEAISKDVVGLDLTNYVKTVQELPSDSYLGVVPQENIRYTLNSGDGKVDIRYTFADGKLRKIHVLESEGSPSLTKTAANTLEMAKGFLNSYQGYSGDSFYGELGSMLNDVDAGKNLTKASGNTKLEVTNSEGYETFKWTYMFNNVEASDKCVALGYKDGFLKYFLDNWNLYKIGSTSVNLSEEEAIEKGIESANAFSWKMGSGNETYRVKDFTVANAMVWETVFLSNLHADTPRSQDPLMLYPMRHVWVSLDKFYPGNVYGINVYVWADTGKVAYIHERVSTLDPPADLVASMDDFTVEAVKDQISADAVQFNVISIPWLALPAFAVVILGIVPVWLARKNNLSKRGFFKICGMLLCVLIFSMMLLGQVSTVNASSQKECIEIWGSESTGAYDSRIPGSWRKTSNEIDHQQQVSLLISVYFSDYYHGYDAYNNQGDGSLKSMILDDISYAEANYPRVAVVDFDHGMGRHDYQGLNEFHFMFEDNIGTFTGDRDHAVPVPDNGVYDMDIYPRTALGKVKFAFINTCGSANLTNLETLQPWQGFMPGTDRARGMPFAWGHRRVGSSVGEIGSNGYSSPDGGDFCYIGFTYGSAALDQTLGGYGPKYWIWVRDFFWYASSPGNSINNALDDVSLDHYENLFGDTCLANNFVANWPMWTYEWEDQLFPNTRMAVYGNGNIHLYRKGGIWHLDGNALDSSHNNNGAVHGATWTYPKFGSYALYFDGSDDYVEMYPFDYDFKEITAEFWMKTSDTTKTGTPISCSSGTQHNEFLIFNYKSFAIYIKGSSVSTGVSANDGAWHHIAVTWRSSDGSVKLYKDGYPVYSGTLRAGATVNLANLIIGQEQDAFRGGFDVGQAFKGVIDEVRIYDYVLSAGQIADNAAIAAYHLNGGNSAYDSSPYGNTGTVSGASWATGTRGYGLSFDGSDDYVNVPDSSSLDLSSAVTVEAWIKPSRLNVWQSPLEKGVHNDWAYGFYIEPAGGNIGFEIGKEGSPVTWAGATAPVNSYLAVGRWSHIVGTADTATHKVCLYIDGVKVAENTFSGQINTNSIPFQIGKRYDGGYFGGVIDEVRIYNRALLAGEIAAHYNEMLPTIFREITVLATNQYSQYGYVPLYMDGQYVGTTGYTYLETHGTHWIGVPSPIYGYDQGHLYMATFQYFYYDSTYNYDNPMNLAITENKIVTAYYYMEIVY